MRSRLLLLGIGGLVLAMGAGDAYSRQSPPGAAKTRAATPVASRFDAKRVGRVAAAQGAGQPGAAGPTGGVDWRTAVLDQRRGLGNNPGGEKAAGNLDQEAVNQTRLPILLPADPAIVASGRLYSFGDYYTLSAEAPGAGLSFSGNAAPFPVDATLSLSPEGPQNLTIIRTVEGRVASYTRFNVLYTVEVTCDQPKDDRCVSDTYIRGLVAQTTSVVLGKAARQAAGLGG